MALHFAADRASQLMGSSTHPLSQRDVHFTAELGAEAMRLACATQIEPADGAKREDCTVLLLISSAAGYERRRDVVRRTYLSLLDPASAASPLSAELRASVKYRFLLGAPEPAQAAALAAEQAEHGDLLQVAVPEPPAQRKPRREPRQQRQQRPKHDLVRPAEARRAIRRLD